MDTTIVINYLKQLTANNNREWFNAHREDFNTANAEFESLVAALIDRISLFDESIRGVQVKDCTYRIYRDVRFSADKSPYKNHFGAYITPQGRKTLRSGYYVHLQPENNLIAGGCYCPDSKLLKAIRQAVYDNMDEYRSIVEDPKFKRFFPKVGNDFLKTAPKGFPKDYEFIDYLKCKDFTIDCRLPDDFFTTPGMMDRSEEIFKELKRYSDFVNYTIDEFEHTDDY